MHRTPIPSALSPASFLAGLVLAVSTGPGAGQTNFNSNAIAIAITPLNWTTAQDHRNMMAQLGITELRPGRNGDSKATNKAATISPAKLKAHPAANHRAIWQITRSSAKAPGRTGAQLKQLSECPAVAESAHRCSGKHPTYWHAGHHCGRYG